MLQNAANSKNKNRNLKNLTHSKGIGAFYTMDHDAPQMCPAPIFTFSTPLFWFSAPSTNVLGTCTCTNPLILPAPFSCFTGRRGTTVLSSAPWTMDAPLICSAPPQSFHLFSAPHSMMHHTDILCTLDHDAPQTCSLRLGP
eukprot:scaffold106441_cov23-Tisochrysis_lutea.AAC.2